jgi:hypothetical protein
MQAGASGRPEASKVMTIKAMGWPRPYLVGNDDR